jgi:hypothetical protein
MRLEWAGPDGPFLIQFRSLLGTGSWEDRGGPVAAGARFVNLPVEGTAGFYRIRLAR